MNNTPPGPAPQSGPRVDADQVRDLRRLRRSKSNRHLAGVAGGLGRHFDIDPTVIRVLLVVLAFFGGAGLVIYGAVWLLVPEDGSDQAPIELSGESQRVLLIVAAVVAGLIFLGSTFSDNGWAWGFPIPIVLLAVVAVIVLATRERRDHTPPPPPWPASTPQEGTTMSSTYPQTAGQTQVLEQPPVPPAYGPPAPTQWTPPPPPPRPRRTGLVLFWPTLALIAIALGTLGIADATYDVPVSAYAALALTVTAVMLIVGAFVGRPGGLIALGLAASLATGITGIVDSAAGGGVRTEDVTFAPTSAAAVQDSYTTERGSLTLDLSRVRDLDSLQGRTVDIELSAGEIQVYVPDGLNVNVDANVRYAGQVEIGDDVRGGFDQSLSRTLTTTDRPGAPTLDLDLNVRVGSIDVEPAN